uniref:Uncharacterized protein n=1 Tax=Rhizophora mucronata TaxID=61149 RepID=A0A2P2NJ22_RHIMU
MVSIQCLYIRTHACSLQFFCWCFSQLISLWSN